MNKTYPAIALTCLFVAPAFAAGQGQTSARPPIMFEGRCTYSDSLAPLSEKTHVFIECDRMVKHDSDGQVEIEFAYPARLRSAKFRGSYVREGKFKVSAIRLRSQNDWEEAEGHCDHNLSQDNVYTVTCLVKKGPRFYVVNYTLGT